MRITAGRYKGRKVSCPKGIIRPAMDQMRESMFSILGNINGLSFLDLFSGSGIVGIEAASRGAEPVVLVEKDRIKKRTLLNNISFVESRIIPYFMPVERYIRINSGSYDLLFLDPPFLFPKRKEIIAALGQSSLVKPQGILMIHYPSEEELPVQIGQLIQFDQRKYGRSLLSFYHKE